MVADWLRPHSYDWFFEEVVGRRPLAQLGGERPERARLLGDDPRQTILYAYETHAPELTCHALAPQGQPPAAQAVADAAAFEALIGDFHADDFTVRIPDAAGLSPELQHLCRALEVIVEKPVGAVVFWSGAGARAPVHYDDIDVLAIQLSGKKRWHISREPATLPNEWKGLGEAPPDMGRFETVDVVPGDLLYFPRGTVHTVESTTESIHVSIGFVPVTLRDALIAAIDHLSDLDKPLRTGVTARADDLAQGRGDATVLEQVRRALDRLEANAASDTFVRDAMSRRRARFIADLPKLEPQESEWSISLSSRVRHNPLAVAHSIRANGVLDLSQPGEQIFVHAGAEQSLDFILENPEFRVADVPGDIGNDVRIALVQRLLASGLLQLAGRQATQQPELRVGIG